MSVKLMLLRVAQIRTFRHEASVIFLTEYARDAVQRIAGDLSGRLVIIPHGINPSFVTAPRSQRPASEFSRRTLCRVLYASIIDVNKHQWRVVEAVAQLRAEGFPIVLDLVGAEGLGTGQLNAILQRVDRAGEFVNVRGAVPYEELHEFYATADIGIAALSCENMPNILPEGMAARLPLACSRMGPMPEILGEAGIYFNPEKSPEIAFAIRQLIESPLLRAVAAHAAHPRALEFTWERCARKTFDFLGGAVGREVTA